MILRDYQTNGINQIAKNYTDGVLRQIFQLPTGGGKTVTFGGLTQRFSKATGKKVVILVHRDELLKQARRTLLKGFNILAESITADNKYINKTANVYVGMIETVYKRIEKEPCYLSNVGMLIVDECHIGNFKKIYDYFPGTLIVGFSATPESSLVVVLFIG